MMRKSYTELSKLKTFEERFEYLSLHGRVGQDTFGFDRYLNQAFYKSPEWLKIRNDVIVRDNGCDLGIDGYELIGRVYIHHINPITREDLITHNPEVLSIDNLISTSYDTHQAIHYGDISGIDKRIIERKPGDTKIW